MRKTYIFDENNEYCISDNAHNMMFLRAMQYYFNNKIKVDGEVYFWKVLKELGFPYDETDSRKWTSDGEFIDFGIDDTHGVIDLNFNIPEDN